MPSAGLPAGSRGLGRSAAIGSLVDAVCSVVRPHPLRIAIDGPDAAGKTTLAGELATQVRNRGRDMVRACVDGFHRPRAERYRQGSDSPRGYYEDAFDYPALLSVLLDPLGEHGDRTFRTEYFDYRADVALPATTHTAARDAVFVLHNDDPARPVLVPRGVPDRYATEEISRLNVDRQGWSAVPHSG